MDEDGSGCFGRLKTKCMVNILVCCCGIPIWMDIIGFFSELPVLINYLPEGWALGSFGNMIIAFGSPFALAIIFLVNACQTRGLKCFAFFALLNQVLQLVLASILWNRTIVIFGSMYSLGLLSILFFMSCTGRAYSVINLSLLSSMDSVYVPVYFIGEGIGTVWPSLVAFAQGSGEVSCENPTIYNGTNDNVTWDNSSHYSVTVNYEEPRFSVQVYFLILAATGCIPLLAFIVLNWNPCLVKEIVFAKRKDLVPSEDTQLLTSGNKPQGAVVMGNESITEYKEHNKELSDSACNSWFSNCAINISNWSPLVLAAFIQMQIYAFPYSLAPYYARPYGLSTLHFVVTFGNIVIPLASVTGLFFLVTSWTVICGLTVVTSSLSLYVIVIAALSPSPPLAGHTIGSVITVLVWCLQSYALAYFKLCLAHRVHDTGESMLLFGFSLEAGFFGGNVLGFILIGVLKLFKEASLCS